MNDGTSNINSTPLTISSTSGSSSTSGKKEKYLKIFLECILGLLILLFFASHCSTSAIIKNYTGFELNKNCNTGFDEEDKQLVTINNQTTNEYQTINRNTVQNFINSIQDLSGNGVRMVVVNPDGSFSSQAIPVIPETIQQINLDAIMEAINNLPQPQNVVTLNAGAGLTGGGTGNDLTLAIGQGTGVSIGGDTVNVVYGSSSGTAVEGSTTLTISAGSNLSGGGSVVLGSGASVSLTTVSNPTFSTSVTTPLLGSVGNLEINSAGNLLISDDALLGSGTFDNPSGSTDLYVTGNLEVDGSIFGTFTGSMNPGLTNGSVLFQGASGISQNNSNFFWDDTNSRLGIGDNTPAAAFTVGAGDLFQVNSSGNLTRINDVAYSWPGSQAGAAGYVLSNDGAGNLSWVAPSGGGSSALSSITAATTGNTILNGDNAQIWNWALTSAGKTGFTFGESTASTSTGTPAIVKMSTLATSTAIPLYISNVGNGLSFRVDDANADTSPFVIDASGNVGVGIAAPTSLLDIKGSNPILTMTNSSQGNSTWKLRHGGTGSDGISLGSAFSLLSSATTEAKFVVRDDGRVLIGTDYNHGGEFNPSRVFIYGGENGANVDIMGEPAFGKDQAITDLQSSDFETSHKSTYLINFGPFGIAANDTLDMPSQNLGALVFANDSAVLGTALNVDLNFATHEIKRMVLDANGNLGIGDLTPTAMLTVGNGDLFQVNSSGAIAAATGITSSGTITFSGLNSAGIVHTNASGVLSTSALNLAGGSSEITGTLPSGNGGTGFATYITGDLLYASATNTLSKLVIGSNGTVLTSNGTIPTWGTLGGSSITADSLDFTEFEDTLDLDAALTLNQTTNTWSQTFTGTTTTGLTYTANSLTSGSAYAISSSATGFTGTLSSVSLTGNNAANTGTLFKVSNTGAANTGTAAMITNLGTGTSFRVNDETGDADTTPFIIDASGNVGIGTASPSYKVDVSNTSAVRSLNVNSAVTSTSQDLYGVYSTVNLDSGFNRNQYAGYFHATGTGGVAFSYGIYAKNDSSWSGAQYGIYTESADGYALYAQQNSSTGYGIYSNGGKNTFSGATMIGTGTLTANRMLDVQGRTEINLGGTQTSTALCGSHSAGTGASVSDVEIVDCTGTPAADYMEMYPVDAQATLGDIVVPTTLMITTKDGEEISRLTRSNGSYEKTVIGIVSDKSKAGDFNSIGHNIKDQDNPQPIALAGRVPVKISSSSQSIQPGDFITTSSELGKGMKATKPGHMVGRAIESWSPNSGKSTVMIFVTNTFADPQGVVSQFALNEKGELVITAYEEKFANQTSKIASLDSNVLGMQATQSAALGSFDSEIKNIKTSLTSFSSLIASLAADVKSLGDWKSQADIDISSLKADIAYLKAENGLYSSSPSATLLTPLEATLSAITITDNANINNLGVTGSFTAGLVTIDGLEGQINTLSNPLKLQALSLGTVEIMGGKIDIDKKGTLALNEGQIKGNDSFRGKATMQSGQTEIRINQNWETTPVTINITSTYNTKIWVEQIDKTGFTVKVDMSPSNDKDIYWVAFW